MNRRTARAVVDAASPLSPPQGPLALSRHRRSAARALLGAPLADRVPTARTPGRDAVAANAALPPARIAGALFTAASGSGVVLGALQASWPLGIAGAVGLLGAAGWGAIGWWRRRASDATAAALSLARQGFGDEALRRLDDLLERTAPALPAAHCAQLVDLKDRLARLSALLRRVEGDEHSMADDRRYVIEALRRYLPDTLLAYLAVPATQRHGRLLDGTSTANALLASQLALLQSELQVREDRLGTAAGAALQRQQRFLQSKVEIQQE